jgi:hypothetical protein
MTPDLWQRHRVEQAPPEPRCQSSSSAPATLARRAAPFAFVLEAFAVVRRGWMHPVGYSCRGATERPGWRVDAHLVRTRNHHRRAAHSALEENCGSVCRSA